MFFSSKIDPKIPILAGRQKKVGGLWLYSFGIIDLFSLMTIIIFNLTMSPTVYKFKSKTTSKEKKHEKIHWFVMYPFLC